MPGGATRFCRSDHMRSKINARAMTDAKISGHMGHPAAWMIDHTERTLSKRSVNSSVYPVIRQGDYAAKVATPWCAARFHISHEPTGRLQTRPVVETSLGVPLALAAPAPIDKRRRQGGAGENDDPGD